MGSYGAQGTHGSRLTLRRGVPGPCGARDCPAKGKARDRSPRRGALRELIPPRGKGRSRPFRCRVRLVPC